MKVRIRLRLKQVFSDGIVLYKMGSALLYKSGMREKEEEMRATNGTREEKGIIEVAGIREGEYGQELFFCMS